VRILVTGATGFIGSNLVSKLSKNKKYKVRCLVRKKSNLKNLNVELVKGDIRHPKTLKKAVRNVDIVVHLAAIRHHYMPVKEIIKTNVDGTRNLLLECKKVKHFIFSSTYLVSDPTDTYSMSKLIGEGLIKKSGIRYTILRLGPIFGKGDETNITRMIDNVKKYPIVPIVGNGKQIICPVHIDDLVRIIEKFIDKKITGVFTVAAKLITINKLIETTIDELDIKRVKLHIPISILKAFAHLLKLVSKKPFITINQLRNLDKKITYKDAKKIYYKYLSLEESIRRTVN